MLLIATSGRHLVHTSPAPRRSSSPERRGSYSRRIVLLGGVAFTLVLCEGVAHEWSALQAQERLDSPASVAALAFGAFSATMTLGRFVADRVSTHRRCRRDRIRNAGGGRGHGHRDRVAGAAPDSRRVSAVRSGPVGCSPSVLHCGRQSRIRVARCRHAAGRRSRLSRVPGGPGLYRLALRGHLAHHRDGGPARLRARSGVSRAGAHETGTDDTGAHAMIRVGAGRDQEIREPSALR